MNAGMKTAPPWHRSASLMLPLVSIGFGYFLLKFSCIYCYGVLGLQTKTTSEVLKSCRETTNPDAALVCRLVNSEVAGGIIGSISGLFQIGIGITMLITKNKPELGNVWAVTNSILLAFVLTSGVLPLHAYDTFGSCRFYQSGSDCNPKATYKDGKLVCAYTYGCPQIKTSDVNGVIVTFAVIAILDAIFLFGSVVITAVIYQAAPDFPRGYYRPTGFPGAVEPTPSQWPTQSQPQISPSQAGVYNPGQQYYGGGQNPQMYRGPAGIYQNQPMPNYQNQPMPNYQNQPMPNYQNQPMPNYQIQPQYMGQMQQGPPDNPGGGG